MTPRRSRLAGALVLAALAGAAAEGCATCEPGRPPVEPRVGGAVGAGSGGFWRELGVGLDVTNLFCRDPEPASPEADGRAP